MKIITPFLFALLSFAVHAEDPFLLIKEKQADDLALAVNEAAKKGYRAQGAIADRDGLGVLMHKADDVARSYMVIDEDKLANLKSRLAAIPSGSFRLLPNTIVSRGKSFGARQYTLLLEEVADDRKYSYLVLISAMDDGMVRTLVKAKDAGYTVVSILPDKDDQVAIIVEKAET